MEAEGKEPHTVPLWGHPAQRGNRTLCQEQVEKMPSRGFLVFAAHPESWSR